MSSDEYQFSKYNLLATQTYQKDILVKAYFDDKKEDEQKITFTWDEQKIGIEYFLPGNVYEDDFVLSNEPHDLAMSQDNLSKMGLQVNGTNLSDLLDKQNKSLDDETVDNTDNLDDNLKIEEKFVKYCTIDAISNIIFANNNASKNTILNSFTASYRNTKNKCRVYNWHDASLLKNIGTSFIFSSNAVLFYNNVANYIDTQKIANIADSSKELSIALKVEFWIILVETILICTLAITPFMWGNSISYSRHGNLNPYYAIDFLKKFLQNLF